MIGLMVFVVVTHVPLQVASVWAVKHPVARIAALLPLIPTLRVTIRGMQPDAYRDGSLYAIMLGFVMVPTMAYLMIFLFMGLAWRSREKGKRSVNSMPGGDA